MKKDHFEGWYFKHQAGGETLAFIPGRAESGAFVQMIGNGGSRNFEVESLSVKDGVIRAGNCVFSIEGAVIDLPSVQGEIRYGPPTKLRGDIMGPFRRLPMECRHEVVSMRHELRGSVFAEGKEMVFDGGFGYIERDSGTSFPSSYQWIQCNAFREPCSVMLSIARIPFLGGHFTGCICAVVYGEREYRLATYKGVRIRVAEPGYVVLSQGNLLLKIDIRSCAAAHSLLSPVQGRMTGTIRESNRACARFRLWEKGNRVFDLRSENAGYEYVE